MISLKKTLIASSAVLAMGISTATLAAYGLPETPAPVSSNNWYIGGFGGVAFTPDTTLAGVNTEYSTGWNAGAEIGYRYDALRFELEYIYQSSSVDKVGAVSGSGEVTVHSGMANILYDFGDQGATYVPYIGGGLGYADLSQTGRGGQGRFAYQAMIGVGFNVIDNMLIDVGYRYFGTTEADVTLGNRFQNHMINAGFIYYIEGF